MPMWLTIVLSVMLGLGLIGGVLFLAIRPEVAARRKKSWWADPSGKTDTNEWGAGPDGSGHL